MQWIGGLNLRLNKCEGEVKALYLGKCESWETLQGIRSACYELLRKNIKMLTQMIASNITL